MTILKSKTVFVVEDDPNISLLLAELFEGEGFKVQVAENQCLQPSRASIIV